MNFFIRQYMANPSMDKNGELIGGTVGYMKALAGLTKKLVPKQIIIVWESGGSPRRLKIYPEYKAGRKPARMNRFYGDLIEDTDENKEYQIHSTIELLRSLPVTQVYVENCEADDVIAYLATKKFLDDDKVIVSSDKDYYQILDESIRIYKPGKKVFVTSKDVFEEYNILPANFAVAKAINGDSSDNVPGVPRAGFKTLAKRFDLHSKVRTINEIIDEAQEHVDNDKKPLKLFKNIVGHSDIIRRNYDLMTLDDRLLDSTKIIEVNKLVEEHKPSWNKIGLWQTYLKKNLDGFDPDAVAKCFQFLIHS
jgi:DNA polymerase-1